jgi:acyl-coenzyme A synthetase/AMP-(fatty) acid ligase
VAFVEVSPEIERNEAIAEELRERCAAELARYKVPSRIELLAHLPRNAMGKMVKPALRGLLRDLARNPRQR